MHVDILFQGLILIGSVGFLVALYYAIKLSKETRHEKYWLLLGISAVFLAVHEWSMIPWQFHMITNDVRFMIEQISAIIGAITFGYAVYGLSTTMKKIRKKLE